MQQKKFDVLVVGELNVDLILNRIEGFPELKKEILAEDLTLTLGSSSAIFASNLSSLDASVSFIGKIGKDSFGQKVLGSLVKQNVDTSFIIEDESLKTGVTVAMNYNEERAMVTHQGAMIELGIDDITDDQIARAKHLHFSSFFLQPKIAKDLHVLMKRAKDLGLTTSFDPQWDPDEKWEMDLDKILPFVDVFLPNEIELTYISGKTDWQEAMRDLSKVGNIIVAKLGSQGSAYIENGKINKVPPFLNNDVVDAIGAGDSFNAGFIKKYIQGEPIEKCAQHGNLIGALSTTNAGGTGAFSNWEQVKKIAKEKFNVNYLN